MLVWLFGLRQSLRPNSQTSNLYCHPSLQDCAGTSPSQTCGRPTAQMALAARLPHFKEEAVTVSSQLLRSLRLLHNCQLTVLVYAPPAPHGERIITREPQCQRERRAPYPAFHNIIPSELCNSRRHRQCSASREEVSRGQKPAKTACRASDYTIRIMLRTLRQCGAKVQPSNSRVRRRRTRHSREGGTTPPSTRERRTLREHQRTVSARIRGRKVQPRRTSVVCEGREPAGSRSAVRASPPP